MRACWFFLFLAAPSLARAGYPDDITLSLLGEYDGLPVTDTAITSGAYETVVQQLAAGIANKPLLPANTLGISGFDISLVQNVTFLQAYDADDPTAWQRTHAEQDPTRVLWLPTLAVRKGLPFSLEVGANLGYLAFSRQAAVGAYGRWAIIEGFPSTAPDFTVQLGYTGYIGNDELELGVMDASATIGYAVPFGVLDIINQAVFTPFAGVGFLRISASPRLDSYTVETLGLQDIKGGEGFTPLALHAGFEVLSNDVHNRLGLAWSPVALPTLSYAVGWTF